MNNFFCLYGRGHFAKYGQMLETLWEIHVQRIKLETSNYMSHTARTHTHTHMNDKSVLIFSLCHIPVFSLVKSLEIIMRFSAQTK